MKNNSHLGETKEHRLKRFQDGPPIEIIETLINSMASFFMNEIGATFDNKSNPQTSLMFLGTHSIALTLSHGFWNKEGKQGYKLFLEHFIDGDTPDTKFSTIYEEIHEMRNIVAHRWINVGGHNFGYDFTMAEGWKIDGDVIFINPQIYLNQFIKTFSSGGRIYRYNTVLPTPETLESAKNRFISKYSEEL